MSASSAKKNVYGRRTLGMIHMQGATKYAPLPDFFKRTVQHEAQIYCRYWFGEDYAIGASSKATTIQEFARRRHDTTVVVVNTHRDENTYFYQPKFAAYVEAETREPTAVFALASPRHHKESIFLWIFRGPSPEEAEWSDADLQRMAKAMKFDESFEISPDQVANGMFDVFGPTKMIEEGPEDNMYYFGSSYPTKWAEWIDKHDPEAHKYYTLAPE